MSSAIKRGQEFRACGRDLLLPAAAKVSKSAGRRGGNSNAPSPAPLPSDQRGPCGAHLWIPPGASARPFGRRAKNWLAHSGIATHNAAERRVRRRRPNGRAASAGKSKRGASAPLWSLRRVGGSKGEGDPFERVPFPLGVLLPSFPTREKKVAPAGAKLPCARYFYGA